VFSALCTLKFYDQHNTQLYTLQARDDAQRAALLQQQLAAATAAAAAANAMISELRAQLDNQSDVAAFQRVVRASLARGDSRALRSDDDVLTAVMSFVSQLPEEQQNGDNGDGTVGARVSARTVITAEQFVAFVLVLHGLFRRKTREMDATLRRKHAAHCEMLKRRLQHSVPYATVVHRAHIARLRTALDNLRNVQLNQQAW
jgi:hypothetical protein